jgi:polyisoprenoid-binding protein YceI
MANTIGTTAPGVTVRYVIDSASSKFTVQAFAGGLLSSFGHNPIIAIQDFSGEARLAEDITQSSLTMTVKTDSLRVSSDISDKDRIELERIMKQRVLQTDEYPEIEYSSSKISASTTGEGQYWAALNGELTLRGVIHALTIPARVTVNGEMLRASGNFSLLQSDYGIEPVSVAGGTLKVKDEVKLAFEIVAKRQG